MSADIMSKQEIQSFLKYERDSIAVGRIIVEYEQIECIV